MKTLFRFFPLAFALLFFPNGAYAQIEHGGAPMGLNLSNPAFVNLPAPEIEKLRAEDEVNDRDKSIPFRFGANIAVDINSDDHGTRTIAENGDRIWRIGIRSEGALSLNFQFDVFSLPEGGQVFIYSPDGGQVKGSYTRENAGEIGSLGVGFIYGDEAVIEYIEPAARVGEGYLHLDLITHGYRDTRGEIAKVKSGPFGNSGPCNINVNCPEGEPYQFEKKSVAVIVVNNNGFCSGALVNNTAEDLTPYFLTANHCLPNVSSQVGNWIFYFNHESPGCTGNTGPTDQSISGATLVARSAESDVALLLLSSTPPESYDVCYSGWDATDDMGLTSSAIGIHHPRGDVKKICFEGNAPYHQSGSANFVNRTWYIDQWESGVTEPGSSGSPLFNQNGLLIGVLSGGAAACNGSVNNGLHDFYGRFGVGWGFGATASARLRDWLDPINSGLLQMPNSCSTAPVPNDLSFGSVTGVGTVNCNSENETYAPDVTVINTGTLTAESITYRYIANGDTTHHVTEAIDLEPGDFFTLSLPPFTGLNGRNTVTAEIINVNGMADENDFANRTERTFYNFPDPKTVRLILRLDQFPEETTWQITSEDGTALYTGGPYSAQGNTIDETFCIGNDICYYFEIFDSASDGLCCEYGQGSYRLVDGEDGSVLARGASFGSSERTTICNRPAGSPIPDPETIFGIYPNPSDKEATFVIKGNKDQMPRITLYDIQGRAVWQNLVTLLEGEIAEVSFPSYLFNQGVYVAVVEVGGERYTERLVIAR